MNYPQFSPASRYWKSCTALASGVLIFGVLPASAHHLEKHFKVGPQPVVTINNPNGKITVRAWTKSEVMVIADHYSEKAVKTLAGNNTSSVVGTHRYREE